MKYYPLKLFIYCLLVVGSMVCCSVSLCKYKKDHEGDRYKEIYERCTDPEQKRELETVINSIPVQQ